MNSSCFGGYAELMEQTSWWRWDPIFKQTPEQWGLRGDSYLWQALAGNLEAEPSPKDASGAKSRLSAILWNLIDPNGPNKVHIAEFDHGGMSSGVVDKDTWRFRLEPLLHQSIGCEFEKRDQRQLEFAAFQEIVLPFAEGILLKSQLLSKAQLNRPQLEAVRSSISVDMRKIGDLVVPHLRPVDVSVGATFQFPLEQLEHLTWQKQPALDPGREHLIQEHVCPVVELRDLALRATSGFEVVQLLWTHMRLAWVTRAEDEKLTQLGYQKVRPYPLVAYSNAGINIFDHPRVRT